MQMIHHCKLKHIFHGTVSEGPSDPWSIACFTARQNALWTAFTYHFQSCNARPNCPGSVYYCEIFILCRDVQEFGPSSSHSLQDLLAPSFSRSFSASRRHARRITLEDLLDNQSKPASQAAHQGLAEQSLHVIAPVGQQHQVCLVLIGICPSLGHMSFGAGACK